MEAFSKFAFLVSVDRPAQVFQVELNFLFTCLLCSRQYGHRVKGISMSKFSKEEIAELQNGGNEVRNLTTLQLSVAGVSLQEKKKTN